MGAEHEKAKTAADSVSAVAAPQQETAVTKRRSTRATRPTETVAVRAKLVVGSTGDPVEREADNVAGQVVANLHGQHRAGGKVRPIVPPRTPTAYPAGAELSLGRVRRMVTPDVVGPAGGDIGPDGEAAIDRARGQGRPLDDSIRGPMETSFGSDFSNVRIHADRNADSLNQRIHARAFTSGNDIFFSNGTYEPTSRDGQRLLAHELTHVVQQGGADTMHRSIGKIRRLTIVDEETGEELRQLTLADLVNELPASVRRALSTLPGTLLAQLAALPVTAQMALLDLPEETQLDVIEALQRYATPELTGRAADAGGSGELVVSGRAEPSVHVNLPPDFVDFLLGRRPDPGWLRPAAPTRSAPMLLGAPETIPALPPEVGQRPEIDDAPLQAMPGISEIERHVGIICARVPALSLAQATQVAQDYSGYSVANLVRIARLSLARPVDWRAIVDGRPAVASILNIATMAAALNARSPADLIELAKLLDRRSCQDVITIGQAGAHRSGAELNRLARALTAFPPADIVTLADVPSTCDIDTLELLGRGITATCTADDVAFLATHCPGRSAWVLLLVGQLPATTTIPPARARAIARACEDHPDLLATAADAQAALATQSIDWHATRLRTIVESRDPLTLPNLMTVLNWPGFADFENMRRIVAHPKIDTVQRLLDYFAAPKITPAVPVTYGNTLFAVLQSPKIETGRDVTFLLVRYSLPQIAQWLGQPWASRADGNKVPVNGRVPVNRIPGTGGTAGQRYTPDVNSGAWPGRVRHLAMSFVLEGPANAREARFTGLHVSWRTAGAPDRPSDPRQWFTVANGRVTVGNTSGNPAVTAAMSAEAVTLMRSMLHRLNCYE